MKMQKHNKLQKDSSFPYSVIQQHSKHNIYNQENDKNSQNESYNVKNGYNSKQKCMDISKVYNLSYQLHHVSNEASISPARHLIPYTRKSYWKSYGQDKETIILTFQHKVLVSELCILNMNATAMDISLAIEDRPLSYMKTKSITMLPHNKETRVNLSFFPCIYMKLDIYRRPCHSYLGLYGVQVLGVSNNDIECQSEKEVCNLVTNSTEKLLFGTSLRQSLPYQDCLSPYISGSPEWMASHRRYSLEEKLKRLESTLFTPYEKKILRARENFLSP